MILRTFLMSLWALVVAGAVVFRVAPWLNDRLAMLATLVLPAGFELYAVGTNIVVRYAGPLAPFERAVHGLALLSGLAVIPSIILATPSRAWIWRAGWGAAVLVSVLIGDATALAGYALALQRAAEGAWQHGRIEVGFALYWGLAPLLAAGAWVWQFWLPAFRCTAGVASKSTPEGSPRSSAPSDPLGVHHRGTEHTEHTEDS